MRGSIDGHPINAWCWACGRTGRSLGPTGKPRTSSSSPTHERARELLLLATTRRPSQRKKAREQDDGGGGPGGAFAAVVATKKMAVKSLVHPYTHSGVLSIDRNAYLRLFFLTKTDAAKDEAVQGTSSAGRPMLHRPMPAFGTRLDRASTTQSDCLTFVARRAGLFDRLIA